MNLRIPLVGAIALLATGAVAADMAPVVKQRQAGMKAIGGQMKAIFENVNASSPDKARLKADAAKLASLAQQTGRWFPKGSGAEAGVDTEAKAEIWKNASAFEAKRRAMAGEALKLKSIADKGDAAAAKAQFMTLRAACKSCHDDFRAD